MRITYISLSFTIFCLGTLYTTSDAASLYCYNKSNSTFLDYSLNEPESILQSSCYDPNRKTVLYAFGFTGAITDDSVKAIVNAYLTTYNIVVVNWEKEASGGRLGNYLGYVVAVRKSLTVGQLVGQAIIKLTEAGLELNKIHCVGFSLGAHLIGTAAREVQNAGKNITKIIGLDPAGPLFDNPISYPRLDASCATYVIIFHTDPGALGTDLSSGTVDIWFNCRDSIQPGCEEATGKGIGIRSAANSCSHNRAWMYYAYLIATRQNMLKARSSDSCETWNSTGLTISLGSKVHQRAKGNYFLQTNSAPNFGKGEAGSIPDTI